MTTMNVCHVDHKQINMSNKKSERIITASILVIYLVSAVLFCNGQYVWNAIIN